MAALCGEIADGIILTRSTTATAREIRAHLAEGTLRAGRRPDEVTMTSLLPTAIGETRQQALDALRPGLAFYAGFFPRYNRLIAQNGFAKEASAIAAAWARGDREAAKKTIAVGPGQSYLALPPRRISAVKPKKAAPKKSAKPVKAKPATKR